MTSMRERLAELERMEAERREKKRARQRRYREKATDAGKVGINCFIAHQVKEIIDQEAGRIGGSIGEAVESIVTRDADRAGTMDAPLDATGKETGTSQATPPGLESIREAVDNGAFYDEIRIDIIRWIEGQKASGRSWAEIARDLNRAGIPKQRAGEWSKASVRALVQRRDG